MYIHQTQRGNLELGNCMGEVYPPYSGTKLKIKTDVSLEATKDNSKLFKTTMY